MPVRAQSADAPIAIIGQPLSPDCPCKRGDVVLTAEEAVLVGKKLAKAEAKVEVYEKTPILPIWGVVLLVVASAAVGAGVTIGIYEAGKGRP